ncbi:hypothetical protein BH23GEM8_BH23GEM8_07850 [soil metagenome]
MSKLRPLFEPTAGSEEQIVRATSFVDPVLGAQQLMISEVGYLGGRQRKLSQTTYRSARIMINLRLR